LKAGKTHTIELIAQLKKEQKALAKKDALYADILSKVLGEAENHLKWHQWEIALEITVKTIEQYQIPMSLKAFELAKKAVENSEKTGNKLR
jgi:hypothetical protein